MKLKDLRYQSWNKKNNRSKRERIIPRTQPCVSRIPREGCNTWPDVSFLVCFEAKWNGSTNFWNDPIEKKGSKISMLEEKWK